MPPNQSLREKIAETISQAQFYEPSEMADQILDLVRKELPKDRKFVVDKVIDESWIKENTTYDELQKWRDQLYEMLEK